MVGQVREGRNGAFHYEHAVGPKDGVTTQATTTTT